MTSNEDIKYTIIKAIKQAGNENLFGIVKYASDIRVSKYSEYFINISLVDDSLPLNAIDFYKLKCIIFSKIREPLKAIIQGCLVRFHRMRFKYFGNELRGENSPEGFAWTVFKTEPNSDYEPIEISSNTFTRLSVESMKRIESLRNWFISNREKILDESDSYKEAYGYHLNSIGKSTVSFQENNEKNIATSTHSTKSILNIAEINTNENINNPIHSSLNKITTFNLDRGNNETQFVSKKDECTKIRKDEEFINLNKRGCQLMSLGECENTNCSKKLRKDFNGKDIEGTGININLQNIQNNEEKTDLYLENMPNYGTHLVKRICNDPNKEEISQIQSDNTDLKQFTIIDDSMLDESCWCLKCLKDVKPPFIGWTKAHLIAIVPSLNFPTHLIKLTCILCKEAYLLPSNLKDESFQFTKNVDYLFPAFIENKYNCPRCSTSRKLVQLEYCFMFRLIFKDGDQLLSCNIWEFNDSYFLDLSHKDILENTEKGLRCIQHLQDIIKKRSCLRFGVRAFKSLCDDDCISFKLHKTKLLY